MNKPSFKDAIDALMRAGRSRERARDVFIKNTHDLKACIAYQAAWGEEIVALKLFSHFNLHPFDEDYNALIREHKKVLVDAKEAFKLLDNHIAELIERKLNKENQ